MARSSIQVVVDQRTPLTIADKSPKGGRQLLRKVIRHLEGILGGVVDASHMVIQVDGAQPLAASGSVTCAAVAAADTFSINGVAQTATELRANCTVTCGTSIDDGDTVTVNGLVLTAKTTPTTSVQFLITGTAATDAAALEACINAQTSALVSGIISANRVGAAVNIYAIEVGTAGNSYTIATSDAVDLAITNDNAGAFAGGAARATDQFDTIGSNIHVARDMAAGILASTTALVSKHVEACNWAGSVTLSTCLVDNGVRIAGHEFYAIAEANATTQGNPSNFTIGGSDTADAAALVVCINTHPVLCHQVVASNSSGVVTIRQRRGTSALGKIEAIAKAGVAISGISATTQFVETAVVLVSAIHEGQSGNAITTASSNGTRLAVTGSAARLLAGTGAVSGTTVRVVVGGTAN